MIPNPSQINRDNVQNVRCETSRTFRSNKREHVKGKLISLKLIMKILEICTEALMDLKWPPTQN
jgi:hypothetical protein